jgi:hypothetical protein
VKHECCRCHQTFDCMDAMIYHYPHCQGSAREVTDVFLVMTGIALGLFALGAFWHWGK